jgi:CO/xanthine dehydrogenase FAD-binding subunit
VGASLDDPAALAAEAEAPVAGLRPNLDHQASSENRVEVASTVVRRALQQMTKRGDA